MGTPHNKAVNGDIARNVIMPGDPVRAEYIAKKYLKDCIKFNDVRCAYGYTGLFNGQRISVMASGMGMPSMGIYSYELYNIYDVDAIIRIGTAGALADNLELKDVVMAMGASTDSAYAAQYNLPGTFAPIADFGLLRKADCSREKRRSKISSRGNKGTGSKAGMVSKYNEKSEKKKK